MIQFLQSAFHSDLTEKSRWGSLVWMFISLLLLRLVFVQPYNPDAGYYASCAKLVLEGMKPYRDFQLGYAPFGIYLLSAFFYITQHSSLQTGFFFIFFLNILSSLVVGRLARNRGISAQLSWLLAAVYLVLIVQNEGSLLVLEPIMALFILLALHFSTHENRQNWFVAGVLLGVVFLTKQYGLLMLPLFVLRAAQSEAKVYSKAGFLIFGFSLPVLLFGFYFFEEIFFQNLLTQTSNRTYQYLGSGIFHWIKGGMNLLGPYSVSLFLFLYFYTNGKVKAGQVVFILLALFLVSVQFWFKIFPHYHILALPFLLLVVAEILELSSPPMLRAVIVLSFAPALFFLLNQAFSTEIRLKKEKQERIAKEILELTHGYNQNILIVNCDEYINPYLYAFNDFYPPDLRKTRFGFESTPEFTPLVSQASCIVLTKEKWWEIECYNPETLKVLTLKKQIVRPDFILCY